MIVAVVSIVILASILSYAYLGMMRSAPPPETVQYSSDVIISNGGHFKYELTSFYSSAPEVTINISSSTGERFDVYIMDENEYQNAYGNASTISFSAYSAHENVSQVSATLELQLYRTFYVIVDNRDTPLTPSDATPTGVLTVSVDITMRGSYFLD